MKLFLIGTLLFSGGSAVAVQNEEVRENVTEMYKNVRERVQKRVKENSFENIRENGFPYPSEERLAELTEEQQVALVTAIDQINATYNWSEMTDEEIQEALLVVQEEMELLAEELGLEVPENFMQKRFRSRVNRRTRERVKEILLEDLRLDGLEYPSEERLANLTEEQAEVLLLKIDELNETYDWASMTDEEIYDALVVVREELRALHEEFGIIPNHPRHNEVPIEEVDPETDSEV